MFMRSIVVAACFVVGIVPTSPIEAKDPPPAAAGKSNDPRMGPLAKPDISNVARGSPEAGNSPSWKIKPMPLNVSRKIAPSFSLRSPPAGSAIISDRVTALFFTGSAANAVLVEHEAVDAPVAGIPGNRIHRLVDRYDLATGNVAGGFEAPVHLEAIDASDTGKTVVFRGTAAPDCLEVWSETSGPFKRVVAFRVVPNPSQPPSEAEAGFTAVRWARMVDDTHVLALSVNCTLALYELPAVKVVWMSGITGSLNLDSFRSDRDLPALSPDRKLLAVPSFGGVGFADPMTGQFVNKAETNLRDTVFAVAFSGDGRQLALLGNRISTTFLEVCDLSTGKKTAELPLPPEMLDAGTSLQFAAPGYVLVGGKYLASLEKECVVWQYAGGPDATVRRGVAAPGERIFYSTLRKGRTPPTVVNIDLPQAEVKKAAAAVRAEDLYAWSPGRPVSISLKVVGDEDYHAAQLAQWTRTLTAHGMQVVDNAPNKLRMTNVVLTSPGKQYQVRGETVKGQVQKLGYEAVLEVAGHEVWRSGDMTPPTDPDRLMIRKKPGETAQQTYDKAHRPIVKASMPLATPMYVFKKREIPQTTLDAGGITPAASTQGKSSGPNQP